MSIKVAQAENLEEFWDLLKEGKETISSFPQQRSKDVHILENNNMKFEVGSYLEDIASFDPYFFNITPREAELMSPIQRLTLEKCLEALDDAGISKKTLNDSKTGIYLGHIGDLEGYKYKNWVNKFYNNDPMAIPGNLNS
ncbi:beta-ketoacyl synthase N-terminal-like domain-containing protein, partial [Streptococcus mutans]